jgi:hypothetical protein
LTFDTADDEARRLAVGALLYLKIVHPVSGTASTITDNPFYRPHNTTGVAKLHTEGLTGSGIIVAVIDDWVDYTHSALGGCFRNACEIGFGTDLVRET